MLTWRRPNVSTHRRRQRRRQRRLRQDNLMASFSFIPSIAAQPRPCCSLSHTFTSSPHVSHHPPLHRHRQPALHHPPPTADLNLVPQRLFDEAAWSFSAAALLHEPSDLCLMFGSVRLSAVSGVCRVTLRSSGLFVFETPCSQNHDSGRKMCISYATTTEIKMLMLTPPPCVSCTNLKCFNLHN